MGLIDWLLLAGCAERGVVGFDVQYGTGVDDGTVAPGAPDPGPPVDPLDVVPLGSWRADWTEPTRLAAAPDGTFRVSEPRHGRIYVLDANGATVQAAEVGGEPLAVAVDRQGRTWVGDGESGAIRIYTPEWTIAGMAGAGVGETVRPSDMAVDPATGWVYVTDCRADQVQAYDEGGTRVGTFSGQDDTALQFPTGIAVGAGEVWVVSHLLKRVVLFDPAGTPLGWFGVLGEEPGELYTPQGVARDGEGRLWVADTRLGRVTAFDRGGKYLGHAGSVGPAPGQLSVPMDVVVDGSSRLVVTSVNNRRLELYAVPGGPK